MYPKKDTQDLTKPAVEGGPAFEKMSGLDILKAHGTLSKNGSKCVEELNKIAVGVSENAATLLALLTYFRSEVTATIPVLNVKLVTRVVRKLECYEHPLHVLDLSRDVPRSGDDVRDAVRAWIELGGELGKPQYATFFAKIQAATPYFKVGTYRVLILTGLANHPDTALENLAPRGHAGFYGMEVGCEEHRGHARVLHRGGPGSHRQLLRSELLGDRAARCGIRGRSAASPCLRLGDRGAAACAAAACGPGDSAGRGG
jgi:hypothetical protein